MNVGIGLKKQAYTPEAYAYADYLKKKGITVQLESEEFLDLNNDINIYFMGIRPFWEKQQGKALEIHEYQSLSTGSFPLFKDYIKKSVNKKPVGRIFLNKIVNDKIGFSDSVPYIYRDMGVDASLFQNPEANPEFDIVYCGSMNGRVGLVQEIERLAKIGFKLLIISDVSIDVLRLFKKYSNVFFTGRVEREKIPGLYAKCKAGLNYTPDIYPFNIQTSTKTLEYLASGLIVISNNYFWMRDFSVNNKISYIDLNEINCFDVLYDFQYDYFNGINFFEWGGLLERAGFLSFVESHV